MNPYQLVGEDVVYAWVASQTDTAEVEAMLAWLVELATDPYEHAVRVPENPAQVYYRPTAVIGVLATYLVSEQFHSVRIISIDEI